jgi:hypothetical protein
MAKEPSRKGRLMEAQEARDKTIAAVKETIDAVTEIGKSHICVEMTDISDAVKEQMEDEGYRFEVMPNQIISRHKSNYLVTLYKISW